MARIVQIHTVANTNNAGGYIADAIKRRLSRDGHEVVVAYGRGNSSDGWRIGNDWSVMAHALASRIADSEGRHSLIATRKFVKELKASRPDLVMLHNVHGHYLHLPTLFKSLREMDIPVTLTLHDYWWITGHCACFYHNDCSPKNGCVKCRFHRTEYPKSWLSRSAYNFNWKLNLLSSLPKLLLICPSDGMFEDLSESQLKGMRCTKVFNGVDTSLFSPAAGVERSGVLAIAARWINSKGLSTLIELANHPDFKHQLTIVGDTMGVKLPDNVKHIGRIDSREELVKIYSSASVMVNPSQSEAFGMVTAEAMACGTPVIGYEMTATCEIVEDEELTFFDPHDIDHLVKLIDNVIVNPGKFHPRERIINNFTLEQMVDEYAQVVNDLLNGRLSIYEKL